MKQRNVCAIFKSFFNHSFYSVSVQVIARTKTPQEIIAEYERIQKEKEERRLQQRTNPRVSII